MSEKKGLFNKPKSLSVHFQNSSFESLIPVSPIPLNKVGKSSADLIFIQTDLGHKEAYKIECESTGITINSNTENGALYALHTLKQIFTLFTENPIPCFEISDYPLLRRRGFMLDVSRCKVPTMESIFSLIDLLSQLRYNELQLYIEHTFAFVDHPTVWQDASPLTGKEIQEIDKYCRERFIELVPNLNSFGHFERWLRHEPYKKLAECPEGFHRDEPYMIRDHGSVL
ncbi:MAG: family 20 glycosylhydrolase, partial [Opitutae bacterium]|nr:family 20 glycosylhydrolase [Opitutae bacterium]